VSNEHEVAPDTLPFEFMLNALRLREGVPAVLFEERTGLTARAISRPLEQAVSRGLMDPDPTRLAASARGFDFLNDLQALFLPAAG
jgi:oxygen-independent coproporphyrinogen-3 oxidase